MTTPNPETLTVNGIPTAHRSARGSGDPVLLLHGWGVDSSVIWPLAQQLAQHGYRVYAPDMPGFGATPAPEKAWTIYDYAQFVVAYLRANQLDKVHLIGHSFGGRLGLILGAEHAEQIDKMVLLDSAGVRPPTPLKTRIRTRVYKTLRNLLYALRLRNLADTLQEAYNKRYGSADFQAVSGVMRETFVKVVNEDLQDYAARVKPSTLLIWGKQDQDTPLWQGQRLEKLIPDAGLVTFPTAGHYSYLDNLAETTRIIDYFFKH